MSPQILYLQLLSLVLIFVLTIPAACNVACDPSEVNDVRSNEQVSAASQYRMAPASRGIKAALIHRNHFSVRRSTAGTDKDRSPAKILGDAARRSLTRGDSLRSRIKNERRLAENSAGQTADWESQLSVEDYNHEYLMGVSLGTPPQTFVVEADTGSDLAWIQCLPRQNFYNQSDSPFDPSKSSTYAKLSCASSACEFLSTTADWCEYSSSAEEGTDCGYKYQYGDSSITNGTLAEDTIYIDTVAGGVQSVSKFWFGCSHNATAGFGLADGLFGLGRGDISFPSQLGQYFGSVFSYCLVNRSRSEMETSPLIFGDDALSATAANGSRLHLQFTPMVNISSTSFYFVDVEGIFVNGVAAPIKREAFAIAESGSGGTIFDSGTPITRLVDEAFDPLVETLSSAIKHYERLNDSLAQTEYYELCYKAPWDTWITEYGKTVPTVSFKFENASSFDLGVANVWDEYDEGIICMMILRFDSDPNIFGNWQQADHHVVYDLENQRIGFASTLCEN